MTTSATQNWRAMVDEAVTFRRALHRAPELTWAEHETAESIRARLDDLGVGWRTCAETGTLATLAPDAGGRHVALRGDIDALPIIEESGVEWCSERDGCMHACGHDGHAATLYAVAQWLKAYESELPGPVTLLFQPAEEGGHGAKAMIDDGALEGVDAIFGWHNWPAMPFGRAVCPDGAVMAGNGTFEIAVRGQGGHASQPQLCRDPVLAASSIVTALQQVVARRISPQAPTVLSVTNIRAEGAPTVIPDTPRPAAVSAWAPPIPARPWESWSRPLHGTPQRLAASKRMCASIRATTRRSITQSRRRATTRPCLPNWAETDSMPT